MDTIKTMVEKAKKAQQEIEDYSQEAIDRVCVAVGWEVYHDDAIKELAEAAVAETKMGNVADKIKKHKNKILGVLKDIKGAVSVGLIERDEKKKISKYAKPVGIVGALTPVTNPTATPASNAVTILKGRNAVIFAPHPRAKKSSALAVRKMRQGLAKAGAPKDLIQIVEEPSVELTQALMQEVDVVLATGGGAMVKAAYSSGTPAYGVGPGNAVQIIAEDADVQDAAKKIIMSKSFDHSTSCSSESGVIIMDAVFEAMFKALKAEGAHVVAGEDRERLLELMWVENKRGKIGLNPAIIAQSAPSIARAAGIECPDDARVLLVEGKEPIEEDLFATEKIAPVLTWYRADDFAAAKRLLERLVANAGTGHSCGIHTNNADYIRSLGETMPTSRIMVNQPQAAGNGGAFFNGMPSTVSLGCGTWGNNITTENINYRHFLNVTWVSEYFTPVKPTDEEIFGDWLQELKGGDSDETA